MSEQEVKLDNSVEQAAAPLSRKIKWLYGVGEIGVWDSGVIVGFFLNHFFLEVANIPPVMVRA
jgi:Na+/melibiose symporter-like transporter